MDKIELWKDIPGYEGLYQASNLGRVKSLRRKVNTSNKKSYVLTERILKLATHIQGYKWCALYKKGSKLQAYVHRLVLLTFVGDSDLECNHKNGIKDDNRLENLEWVSSVENNRHRRDVLNWRPGTGEKSASPKLTDIQVMDILKGNDKPKILASKYGVTASNICAIRKRKSWKHLITEGEVGLKWKK